MLTSSRYRSFAVLLFFFALAGFTRPLQVPAQDPKAQPASANKNQRAHALLDAASKLNGLVGDDVKPWHLKGTWTVYGSENKKSEIASLEEWSAARYRWRIDYASKTSTSTVWSVSRAQELKAKKDYLIDWEPVTDPVSSAASIKPDYELDLVHLNLSVPLDCVSVVHPERYKKPISQEFFPNLCFDEELRLRLESEGSFVVEYDVYQMFQNHAVAGYVRETDAGKMLWEYRQTALEALSPGDQDLLTPGKEAVPVPHKLDIGDPQPVPVHRQAGPTYVQASDYNASAIVWIPIVIQKDGSVRTPSELRSFFRTVGGYRAFTNFYLPPRVTEPLFDAAEQWRFEPYLVDGIAVEVTLKIPFTEDGQPWGQW
jgi:hypothetical protein